MIHNIIARQGKKLFIIICILSLILAACSGSGGQSFQDDTGDETEDNTQDNTDDDTETGDEKEEVKTSAELLSVSADGAPIPFELTTTLTLNFDQFITGLAAEKITIASESGTVNKGALTQTATTGRYTLAVEALSSVGTKIDITVTVSGVAGYEIGGEKTASLFTKIAIPDKTAFAKIGVDVAFPLGGYYKQTADIDFSDETTWTPIGSAADKFNGSFDGGGFNIKNINLTGISQPSGGFSIFGEASDATFKDIHIAAGNISGSVSIGGIASSVAGTSTITNCSNAANLTSSSGGVYGICGSFSGEMTGCYNSGKLTAASTAGITTSGGITNLQANSTMDGCYNTGDIEVTAPLTCYVAGISPMLYSGSAITACYNTGDITVTGGAGSPFYAAGIVASMYTTGPVISACYNTGDITVSGTNTGNVFVGGIGARVYNNSATPKELIIDCYNKGNISSTVSAPEQAFIGGISGLNEGSPVIIACYNTGNVSAAGGYYKFLGGITGASKVVGGGDCVITSCYWSGAGPVNGLGYRAVAANYSGGANGAADNTGTTKLSEDWPTASGDWGSDSSWVSVGASPSTYPKLWFEN
jgi:hypothetical protein